MSDVNDVRLIGRIATDPEIRKTNSDLSVVTFSFATEDSYKNKSTGKYEKSTEFHNCIAYGRTGESINNHAPKGSALFIRGKNKTSAWEDKESGRKRYKVNVVVESWMFQFGKNVTKSGSKAPFETDPNYEEDPGYMDDDLAF